MSTADHPVTTPCIPHAEVWTPTRSMLNHTLPLPSTDEHSLRKLARSSQRRKETSAMRQVWKSRGNLDRKLPGSVLGQYKQMLAVKDVGNGNTDPTVQLHHHPVNSKATSRSNLIRRRKLPSAPQMYPANETKTIPRSSGLPEQTKSSKAKDDSKRVSSYSLDYVQKVGTSLPKIPVRTLSADWWSEIQKRPMTPIAYFEPLTVEPDRDRIKRQLVGKFFMKNSTQTYFQSTVPRLLQTYNIHPEFDSEYMKCW